MMILTMMHYINKQSKLYPTTSNDLGTFFSCLLLVDEFLKNRKSVVDEKEYNIQYILYVDIL